MIPSSRFFISILSIIYSAQILIASETDIEFSKLKGLVLTKKAIVIDPRTGEERPDLPPVEHYHQKGVRRYIAHDHFSGREITISEPRKVIRMPNKKDGTPRPPILISYPSEEVGRVIDEFYDLGSSEQSGMRMLLFLMQHLKLSSGASLELQRTEKALQKLQRHSFPEPARSLIEKWHEGALQTERLISSIIPKIDRASGKEKLDLLKLYNSAQLRHGVCSSNIQTIREGFGGIEFDSPEELSATLVLAKRITDHVLGELPKHVRKALKSIPEDEPEAINAFALHGKRYPSTGGGASTTSSTLSIDSAVASGSGSPLSAASAHAKLE